MAGVDSHGNPFFQRRRDLWLAGDDLQIGSTTLLTEWPGRNDFRETLTCKAELIKKIIFLFDESKSG